MSYSSSDVFNNSFGSLVLPILGKARLSFGYSQYKYSFTLKFEVIIRTSTLRRISHDCIVSQKAQSHVPMEYVAITLPRILDYSNLNVAISWLRNQVRSSKTTHILKCTQWHFDTLTFWELHFDIMGITL